MKYLTSGYVTMSQNYKSHINAKKIEPNLKLTLPLHSKAYRSPESKLTPLIKTYVFTVIPLRTTECQTF